MKGIRSEELQSLLFREKGIGDFLPDLLWEIFSLFRAFGRISGAASEFYSEEAGDFINVGCY